MSRSNRMVSIGVLSRSCGDGDEYKGLVSVRYQFELISRGIDVGRGEILYGCSLDLNVGLEKARYVGIVPRDVAKYNRDGNGVIVSGQGRIYLHARSKISHAVTMCYYDVFMRKCYIVEADIVN